MKYKVIWLQSALDGIARSFIPLYGTVQGEQFVSAMAAVDRRLEFSADQEGESRSGKERVLFEPPLLIEFEVHSDEQLAIVTLARYRSKSTQGD